MFTAILLTVIVSKIKPSVETLCNLTDSEDPIAAKDGTLVIGGLFQMGSRSKDGNGCRYQHSKKSLFYQIQRVLSLRHLIGKVGERFERDFNMTLGYEMYDVCSSLSSAIRMSTKLSNNEKVVGISGVDNKNYIKESAMVTTAFHIPTFAYIYNDDDLMDSSKFPTLFSMIDTETVEAKITIQILKLMHFRYMDIWYHPFSQEMAEYIYQHYTLKGGCGRIAEIDQPVDVPKIGDKYNTTGGKPADVQLILSNSYGATQRILKYMVNELKFRDKIYIFGYSVGREKYVNVYNKIVTSEAAGNSTLIFPIPDLSNTKLKGIHTLLDTNWSKRPRVDKIDELYTKSQLQNWTGEFSNWIPHVIGGFDLFAQSLYANMMAQKGEMGSCPLTFRHDLYRTIIDEDEKLNSDSDDPYLSTDLKIVNKTVQTGYQVGVYQSHTGKYEILGRAFPDSIDITNSDVLQKISIYQLECSSTCNPGSYRLFEEETLKYLPCCWTCAKCPHNHYSNKYNQNVCKSCKTSETASENMTACNTISESFIKPGSDMFIIGSCLAPLGLAMVIICGIIIFKNEDRPVIKASDPTYLYMILISLSVAYFGSIVPLLKPSQSYCTTEFLIFVVFTTMITVNLLFKCIKIYGIFSASRNFRQPKFGKFLKKTGHMALNITVLIINIVLVVLDCYTVDGPTWKFYREQSDPHTPWNLMCRVSKIEYIIPPLIIPSTAFLATLTLAFKMRNFPHNFRETLNIFAATFVVLLCLVMFLGGYTLSPAYIRSFLRCTVTLVVATAFLLCLFIPKLALLFNKNVDLEEEKRNLKEDVKKFSSKCKESRPSLSTVTKAIVFQERINIASQSVEMENLTVDGALET